MIRLQHVLLPRIHELHEIRAVSLQGTTVCVAGDRLAVERNEFSEEQAAREAEL